MANLQNRFKAEQIRDNNERRRAELDDAIRVVKKIYREDRNQARESDVMLNGSNVKIGRNGENITEKMKNACPVGGSCSINVSNGTNNYTFTVMRDMNGNYSFQSNIPSTGTKLSEKNFGKGIEMLQTESIQKTVGHDQGIDIALNEHDVLRIAPANLASQKNHNEFNDGDRNFNYFHFDYNVQKDQNGNVLSRTLKPGYPQQYTKSEAKLMFDENGLTFKELKELEKHHIERVQKRREERIEKLKKTPWEITKAGAKGMFYGARHVLQQGERAGEDMIGR